MTMNDVMALIMVALCNRQTNFSCFHMGKFVIEFVPTVNVVMALILRYSTEFGSFRGALRKSG